MSADTKFYYLKLKNNKLAYCFTQGKIVYYFNFFSEKLDIDNLVKQEEVIFVTRDEVIAEHLVLLDFIKPGKSKKRPEKYMQYNEQKEQLEVLNKDKNSVTHATRKDILGSCNFEISNELNAEEILDRLLIYSFGLQPNLVDKIERKYKYFVNYTRAKEEPELDANEKEKLFETFYKEGFMGFAAKNGFRNDRKKRKVVKGLKDGLEFVIQFNKKIECEVYLTARWLMEYPFEQMVNLKMRFRFPIYVYGAQTEWKMKNELQHILDILQDYYVPIFEKITDLDSLQKKIADVAAFRALSDGELLFSFELSKASLYDFYLATNQKDKLIELLNYEVTRPHILEAYRKSLPERLASLDKEIAAMQQKVNQQKVEADFSYLDENKKLVPVTLSKADEKLLESNYCDWFVEAFLSAKPIAYKVSALGYYFTLAEDKPDIIKQNIIIYLSLCLSVQEQNKEKVRRMLSILKVDKIDFAQAPTKTIVRFMKMNARLKTDTQEVDFYRKELTTVSKAIDYLLGI